MMLVVERESDAGNAGAELASEAQTQMQLQLGNATSPAFTAFLPNWNWNVG